jgi:hypothetical protein
LLVLDQAPSQILEIKGLLIDLRERFGSGNVRVVRHIVEDQAVVDRHHVAMTGEVDEEQLVHSPPDAHAGDGDLSNFDNMALVGVLSTQLLFQQFIVDRAETPHRLELSVDVDYQDVPGVYA